MLIKFLIYACPLINLQKFINPTKLNYEKKSIFLNFNVFSKH